MITKGCGVCRHHRMPRQADGHGRPPGTGTQNGNIHDRTSGTAHLTAATFLNPRPYTDTYMDKTDKTDKKSQSPNLIDPDEAALSITVTHLNPAIGICPVGRRIHQL